MTSTEGWIPARGDYGTHYAADLIPIIERHNCVKGCTHSGDAADRAEFGPGGNCEILMRVCIPAAVPEIEPRRDGPHCTARQDPATVDMDPLFSDGVL
jgi:hypothetical protein